LHIGPHKTGTTFVQKFFLDNASAIANSGLLYPTRFLRHFGHHDFRDALASRSLTQQDLDFLNDADSNMLLSSEDMISLDSGAFEYLHGVLPQKRFVVLYTWRRASFRLYSIWQEIIKHGGTCTFFYYYHEHLARPDQSEMLSPDLKLSMLSELFGKENIRVVDYDASEKNQTLTQDFLCTLDIPWSRKFIVPIHDPAAENRSLAFEDVEAIRALNQIMAERFGIRGASTRKEYLRQSHRLDQLGLSDLKKIIYNYREAFTVGNYYIDDRCEKIMAETFRGSIINYKPNHSRKMLVLAKPEWMLNLRAQNILNSLADTLAESISA
jgi:hypothetical protein